MRLVAHIIKKYYTQNVDQDDLISIGTIGLIKGISSYKPEKNVRLATYAARCIENATLSPPRLQVQKKLQELPGAYFISFCRICSSCVEEITVLLIMRRSISSLSG